MSNFVKSSYRNLIKIDQVTLEKDFKEKGRDLIYLIGVKAKEQNLNNTEPLAIFESFFAYIILQYKKIDSDLYIKYLKLCKLFAMTPKYTSLTSINNIKRDETLTEAARVLAYGGAVIISYLKIDDLQQKVSDFLVSFAILMGNFSIDILNVIEKIVDDSVPRTLVQDTQAQTAKATSLTASFGSFHVIEDEPIKIVKHGASFYRTRYDNCLSFGLELFNPNKSRIAKRVEIEINILNRNNAVIDRRNYTINQILPNSKAYLGEEMSGIPIDAFNYNVNVKCTSFYEMVFDESYPKFDTKKVSMNNDGYATHIKYNVINTSDIPVRNGNAYLVFKNENKEIVGGCAAYFNELSKGITSLIDFRISVEVPMDKTIIYIDYYR